LFFKDLSKENITAFAGILKYLPELENIKFYNNPLCPFAHRTWLTLLEKGLPFETIQIPLATELRLLDNRKKDPLELLEQFPSFVLWTEKKKTRQQLWELKDWYKQHINPTGEVPTIETAGKIVPESDICSEFVDELFPHDGARLVPTDPYKRATVRLAIKTFSSYTSQYYALLTNQVPEKDAELGEKIHASITPYFALFTSSDGPYLLGKDISLGDIISIPFFDRARILLHYRGFSVIPGPEYDHKYPWAPRARTWWAAVTARDSYKHTTQSDLNLFRIAEGHASNQLEKDGKWIGRGISNTFTNK